MLDCVACVVVKKVVKMVQNISKKKKLWHWKMSSLMYNYYILYENINHKPNKCWVLYRR